MLSLERPAVDKDNKPLGFKYTADQVKAALHAPNRTMFFRYHLLDKDNKFKKQLTTVTGGSVSYDYTQQIQRTAKFNLQDDGTINFLSDRIQPFALLYIPPSSGQSSTDYAFVSAAFPAQYERTVNYTQGGAYAQFPLGVFMLSTSPRKTDNALVVTRNVQGYDQNQILHDWKTTDTYVIPAGTNYIEAVKNLLTDAGITQTNLTATTLTTPADLVYQGGTSYLDIINGTSPVTGSTMVMGQTAGLLEQINYHKLWFDENGVATAEPWVNPSTVAPGYTYANDSDSVMLPQVDQNIDLFSVPNVWVVVVAQTTTATLSSTYTNDNANSPTSTVSRGRKIVHYEQNMNAPTSEALASYAKQLAFIDSQVYEVVTLETAIMPFHANYDVVKLDFTTLGISENFSESGWSFTFSAGATMTHTLRKIVQV